MNKLNQETIEESIEHIKIKMLEREKRTLAYKRLLQTTFISASFRTILKRCIELYETDPYATKNDIDYADASGRKILDKLNDALAFKILLLSNKAISFETILDLSYERFPLNCHSVSMFLHGFSRPSISWADVAKQHLDPKSLQYRILTTTTTIEDLKEFM